MQRREFVTLIGGAAAVWSVTARAQQRGPTRRIGTFILAGPGQQLYARALREGLEALGWVDGKNIQVDYRWTEGDVDGLRSDAVSLVALDPEVIVSGGTQATIVLKEATERIPIVFVHVADPVRGGLVRSLARPEGNITGFAAYESTIAGKWLELLKEMTPHVKHVLVLAGPNPTWRMHVQTMETAGPSFELQLTIAHVHDSADIKQQSTLLLEKSTARSLFCRTICSMKT